MSDIPDKTAQERHIEVLELETRRADLAAVQVITKIMHDGESDSVRLRAAEAWLNHTLRTKEALVRLEQAATGGNVTSVTFVSPGDEKNVNAIRDKFLNGIVPTNVSASGGE